MRFSFENECPSPDGRENPFCGGVHHKRLEGQQETAPEIYTKNSFKFKQLET